MGYAWLSSGPRMGCHTRGSWVRRSLVFVATEDIKGGSVLVSVPKELMLTTKTAFYSEVQEIFEAHPQFYSQYHSGGWQDRILLTLGSMIVESKNRKSEWYHLIRNLPKDIDYLIFWDEEELKLLGDQQMIENAKKERKEFEVVQETLTVILDKYPRYFKKETYSYDNIKWIYIHLVSRCFGSNLAQVAFVPFCEMFNHENTDVRYAGYYKDTNPNKHLQTPMREIDSSDESDGELDDHVDSDEEYPPDCVQAITDYKSKKPIYKQIEEETDLARNSLDPKDLKAAEEFERYQEKQANRTELQILYMKNKRWVQENINLKDQLSIIFVNKIIQQMQEFVKQYDNDQVQYNQARANLETLNANCGFYLKAITEYHKRVNKLKEYRLLQFDFPEKPTEPMSTQEILEQPVAQGVQLFDAKDKWEEDKFDNFIIQCSKKDEFQKGAQGFFSYGTLSNRLLLLRYGFALEYNIFEHVYIRLPVLETIPYALDIADYFKLPKYSRFKIKYNRINEDLLMYFKLQNWHYSQGTKVLFDSELDQPIFEAMKVLEAEKATLFKKSLEEEEQLLYDKSLGYHQYFAQVFKVDRQRVLESQIEALLILRAKLQRKQEPATRFGWTSKMVQKFLASRE